MEREKKNHCPRGHDEEERRGGVVVSVLSSPSSSTVDTADILGSDPIRSDHDPAAATPLATAGSQASKLNGGEER